MRCTPAAECHAGDTIQRVMFPTSAQDKFRSLLFVRAPTSLDMFSQTKALSYLYASRCKRAVCA